MRERMQLGDDYARRTYEQWVVAEEFFPRDGEVPPAGLQAMEDLLLESGEATAPLLSRDRYLDLRYLERARQQ
jgi:hypothetical protein